MVQQNVLNLHTCTDTDTLSRAKQIIRQGVDTFYLATCIVSVFLLYVVRPLPCIIVSVPLLCIVSGPIPCKVSINPPLNNVRPPPLCSVFPPPLCSVRPPYLYSVCPPILYSVCPPYV